MMWKSVVLSGVLLVMSGVVQADGGVSFSRNRMVYQDGTKSISIAVQNHGDTPYLIQAGVSGEVNKSTPAPFVVTPPLFRLDGNTQNMMRIVRMPAPLPQDRESVFYFYATAIPGQDKKKDDAKAENSNTTNVGAQLSIAMRTVLKLFLRPAHLPVTPEQAHGMLHFIQQGDAVRIHNPTPYYQSFAQMKFDGVPQDLDRQDSMVAPMSDLVFQAGKTVHKVTWSVMTDYGGATDFVTQDVETH